MYRLRFLEWSLRVFIADFGGSAMARDGLF